MADATPAPAPSRGAFLGWRAQRRPQPAFAHVLGAAAGAFVVIALVAFVAAIDSEDPSVSGTLLGLLLAIAALAVGLRGPGPLRSACVTVLVLATPFIAVGSVIAIIGGIALTEPESGLATGVSSVLIGAAVGIVGAAGPQRRATTWLGVLTVFGGMVAILVDIAPSSEAGVGAIAFAFALGLGALAWWLAPGAQRARRRRPEPRTPNRRHPLTQPASPRPDRQAVVTPVRGREPVRAWRRPRP